MPVPAVTAAVLPGGGLRLTLSNTGSPIVRYTLASNDFSTCKEDVSVGGNSNKTVDWTLVGGYYDVVVTANTGDGFRYRFAGYAG